MDIQHFRDIHGDNAAIDYATSLQSLAVGVFEERIVLFCPSLKELPMESSPSWGRAIARFRAPDGTMQREPDAKILWAEALDSLEQAASAEVDTRESLDKYWLVEFPGLSLGGVAVVKARTSADALKRVEPNLSFLDDEEMQQVTVEAIITPLHGDAVLYFWNGDY